jgi:hypothetical protein
MDQTHNTRKFSTGLGMKNKNFRSAGWCEVHEKHLYLTRRIAKAVCRQHPGKHKTPYPCDAQEGCWHIGGLAKDIIRGRYERADFYDQAS